MSKKTIEDNDYNEYVQYIEELISLKESLIDFEENDQSINDFREHLNNRSFVSISKDNTKTIKFGINTEATLTSEDDLNKSYKGSIDRKNQTVSVSNHAYNYHIGSSSSLNIGDNTSVTTLDENYEKTSIKTANTTSIAIGDTSSETTINGKDESYNDKDSSSVNIFDTITSNSKVGTYANGEFTINSFHKYSTTYTHHTNHTILSADFSFMPLKGNFTAIQQVMCGLYGDLPYSENLYRIFNFVYTIIDNERSAKNQDMKAASMAMYLKRYDSAKIRRRLRGTRTRAYLHRRRAAFVNRYSTRVSLQNNLAMLY
jgi:hypothetical protein